MGPKTRTNQARAERKYEQDKRITVASQLVAGLSLAALINLPPPNLHGHPRVDPLHGPIGVLGVCIVSWFGSITPISAAASISIVIQSWACLLPLGAPLAPHKQAPNMICYPLAATPVQPAVILATF